MTVPHANQAINEDYFNNSYKVNRGHLFPLCHAADLDTAKSTFTLTNAVPQKVSFNGGSWSRMEEKTKNVMNSCKIDNNVLAHVLTGAIPGNNELKEKVNIPSYMWMAFCCYVGNKLFSQAYWAPNEEEEDPKELKTINEKSLQELQEFLSQKLRTKVQLFENDCINKPKCNPSDPTCPIPMILNPITTNGRKCNAQ